MLALSSDFMSQCGPWIVAIKNIIRANTEWKMKCEIVIRYTLANIKSKSNQIWALNSTSPCYFSHVSWLWYPYDV
jgi:hypothetical protein